MSDNLVEVRLHPIPPSFDPRSQEGLDRLNGILGTNWPFFQIQISQETADSNRVPFYYMPIEFQSPEELQKASPTPRSHRIMYNIVHKFQDQESGVLVMYGIPIQ